MTPPATAVVNGRGARRARRGHPWVYRDDVLEAAAHNGDVVHVVDRGGQHCCWAAYSERSRIALRRITAAEATPDDAWFERALERALALRGPRAAADAGCVRLLHADADGFPGLVVDRYAGHLVCQATTAWADRAAPALLERLRAATGTTSVLARNDASVREVEGLARGVVPLSGTTPEEVVVEEAGLPRLVDPWHGHKTGLYLDQQENHRQAAAWLGTGRVLDLFAAEGGFALPLAAAGATVMAVDQSRGLLERAERTARIAEERGATGASARIELVEGNAFAVLTALDRDAERFDAVVLDPPPFARHRGEAAGAARGYKDLHRRALRLLAPGGRLLSFSCSFAVSDAEFEAIVREAAEEAGAFVRIVGRPGPGPDHPERLDLPESRYLKGLLLERCEG